MFVNGQPMLSTHFLLPPFPTDIARRKEEAQQRTEIHLYGCASCTMSGAGSPIYPATPNSKTCMPYMKPKSAAIGGSLLDAIRKNLRKAVQRGNVSRRGNLSLRCPNRSQTSMIPISCYDCSRTALRKSTVQSALLPCTTTNARPTIISISSFRKGNCYPNR